MPNVKGKILRIRPGHLANFSAGAGFMPFITMYSVTASLLFGIFGSLALHGQARHLLAQNGGARTGLHEFVRFARWHTLVCVILASVVGTALFCWGQTLVYGDKGQYALVTLVYAAGPFVAWLSSSLLLIGLIGHRGARWTNLLLAAAAYILLLLACIAVIMLISAITGVKA